MLLMKELLLNERITRLVKELLAENHIQFPSETKPSICFLFVHRLTNTPIQYYKSVHLHKALKMRFKNNATEKCKFFKMHLVEAKLL